MSAERRFTRSVYPPAYRLPSSVFAGLCHLIVQQDRTGREFLCGPQIRYPRAENPLFRRICSRAAARYDRDRYSSRRENAFECVGFGVHDKPTCLCYILQHIIDRHLKAHAFQVRRYQTVRYPARRFQCVVHGFQNVFFCSGVISGNWASDVFNRRLASTTENAIAMTETAILRAARRERYRQKLPGSPSVGSRDSGKSNGEVSYAETGATGVNIPTGLVPARSAAETG